MAETQGGADLVVRSAAGRWVLAATILGSSLASLDATVVNIALPRIETDLGGGLATVQWTVNAYALALAAFLLLGGSLGDRLGRRRVFLVGVVWFALASAVCAAAPTSGLLIAARALQGVGGALLTPGSLALLEAEFAPRERAAAIGAWSGFAGVAVAIGPFLGGWLIAAVSWRLIFLINLPLAALVVVVALRHVPESRAPGTPARLDVVGTGLAAVGLTGLVYALTEGPSGGWGRPLVLGALVVGVGALVAFVPVERRRADPLLPLGLFSSAQFSAANGVTLVVYAALGGALFLLPLQLQRVLHYSPTAAGAALLPVTVVLFALSARNGRLATRIGPRLPMTAGPLVAAGGLLILTALRTGPAGVAVLLVGMTVFGLGLSFVVAPLTATVLAAAPPEHAGVASAVNTDVARTAQLLAVALLPVAAGITSASYNDLAAFSAGFTRGMELSAGLLALGGVLAFFTIRRPLVAAPEASCLSQCPLDGPGLGGAAVAAGTGS
jgi:EmrB/QacA subfamily drug resistance transporter